MIFALIILVLIGADLSLVALLFGLLYIIGGLAEGRLLLHGVLFTAVAAILL